MFSKKIVLVRPPSPPQAALQMKRLSIIYGISELIVYLCFLKVVLHFEKHFCWCFTNVALEDTAEAVNEALVDKVPDLISEKYMHMF